MKAIQGHKIDKICYSCSIKYCSKPKRLNKVDGGETGLCPICEVLGPQQAVQTIWPVEYFGKVLKNPLFTEYDDPNI